MKNTLTFEQLPQAVSAMSDQISELKKLLTEKPVEFKEDYMTRQQVADMLDVNIVTVSDWVKKDKLKAYGIGNRVYFKRSEVEQAIKPIN